MSFTALRVLDAGAEIPFIATFLLPVFLYAYLLKSVPPMQSGRAATAGTPRDRLTPPARARSAGRPSSAFIVSYSAPMTPCVPSTKASPRRAPGPAEISMKNTFPQRSPNKATVNRLRQYYNPSVKLLQQSLERRTNWQVRRRWFAF